MAVRGGGGHLQKIILATYVTYVLKTQGNWS